MAEGDSLSMMMRAYLAVENYLLTHLVPQEKVGPFFRLIFKFPLLLKDLGMGFLIPPNVLILTTRGRVTGNLHRTPVEYSYHPDREAYLVMAGWEGRTDWYRNARAHPQLEMWVKGEEMDVVARPVPDQEVAAFMKEATEINPGVKRIWSRWSGMDIDGSDASYLAAAPHFPSLYLVPVKDSD